ncbi:MAG: tricarballylate utilization 4Fe-4S protein TcuB [Burkholderiaceae bacterium]|jgi:citrate/tricarballylate utilization protein
MPPLESLTHEALAYGNGKPANTLTAHEQDAVNQLQVCNACRYCEGFCAMFPAMTQRLLFEKADTHYLANLCHNCGACLHACQYAPPHEFGINIPKVMAEVRGQTYQSYAWPKALGSIYQRNSLVAALALVIAFALFLVLAVWLSGPLFDSAAAGDFYKVFPHNLLVGMFGPVFLFAVIALGMGIRGFLREIRPATGNLPATSSASLEAAQAALSLKYLDGGHGEGCNNDDDAFTLARRRYHHFTFYGFMLCFAATALGTVYHYAFGWVAPYDFPSLPKVLGAAGGIGLVIGTAGLWHLNRRRHPLHGDPAQKSTDLGFIALLFIISVSGLALWWLRDTPAMALLLCAHLASVMALFVTLPYGKFAHGFYRIAALVRYGVERRR